MNIEDYLCIFSDTRKIIESGIDSILLDPLCPTVLHSIYFNLGDDRSNRASVTFRVLLNHAGKLRDVTKAIEEWIPKACGLDGLNVYYIYRTVHENKALGKDRWGT
jgi:hypothetical protein